MQKIPGFSSIMRVFLSLKRGVEIIRYYKKRSVSYKTYSFDTWKLVETVKLFTRHEKVYLPYSAIQLGCLQSGPAVQLSF